MLVNVYTPLPLVVVVRLPSATVAPLIGFVVTLSVTVPETVPPAPTVVQEGNLKDPMRVRLLRPVVA
jgi:hypothetical protein